MDWNLLISTLVTIGALGTTMWAMLHFMLRDIHKDMTSLAQKSERNEQRLDQLYQTIIQMLQK
jgi:hypothetical protein